MHLFQRYALMRMNCAQPHDFPGYAGWCTGDSKVWPGYNALIRTILPGSVPAAGGFHRWS